VPDYSRLGRSMLGAAELSSGQLLLSLACLQILPSPLCVNSCAAVLHQWSLFCLTWRPRSKSGLGELLRNGLPSVRGAVPVPRHGPSGCAAPPKCTRWPRIAVSRWKHRCYSHLMVPGSARSLLPTLRARSTAPMSLAFRKCFRGRSVSTYGADSGQRICSLAFAPPADSQLRLKAQGRRVS
jgi:hypothetical protein